MKFQDLTGQRFGRLTVIERVENKCTRTRWKCLCDCGNETITYSNLLKKGVTRSCGCLRNEIIGKMNRTHGMTDTRLNVLWRGMKARCYYKKHKDYKYYGGRGIGVCKEWRKDFTSFHNWAKQGYKEGLTLDRIDGNKDYSPDNCRWATLEIQNNNKDCVKKITINGKTHTISEWSKITGISKSALRQRIKKKWPKERLLVPQRERGRGKKKKEVQHG